MSISTHDSQFNLQHQNSNQKAKSDTAAIGRKHVIRKHSHSGSFNKSPQSTQSFLPYQTTRGKQKLVQFVLLHKRPSYLQELKNFGCYQQPKNVNHENSTSSVFLNSYNDFIKQLKTQDTQTQCLNELKREDFQGMVTEDSVQAHAESSEQKLLNGEVQEAQTAQSNQFSLVNHLKNMRRIFIEAFFTLGRVFETFLESCCKI